MKEKFPRRPDIVKAAIRSEDHKALSRMGRKGAEATKEKKRKERDQRAVLEAAENERRQQEDTEAFKQANYHILSPDGDGKGTWGAQDEHPEK